MEIITVKIFNESGNKLPKYATSGSSGMDVISEDTITLVPGQRALIHTGLYLDIPSGYECQVRPRSGNALKHGITVLNTPGTIDSDYRGEVGIILINLSDQPFDIIKGQTKIAQLVFSPVVKSQLLEMLEMDLSETDRGSGGFGSTDENTG